MGEIKIPEKVKLIIGILISKGLYNSLFDEIVSVLGERFGEIDYKSELIDFNFTNYYSDEMGKDVFRIFISFKKLIDKDDLSEIKLFSNKLEENYFGKEGLKRPVNLDPGYIELSKLVLASTKNFYHRIYLKDGIYGEVTLFYSNKKWNNLPWTFPDYRTDKYKNILIEIRKIYKKQLK